VQPSCVKSHFTNALCGTEDDISCDSSDLDRPDLKTHLEESVESDSGVPRNFFEGGGSTNSVEDRGQIERGSRGGSPPSQGFWRQL